MPMNTFKVRRFAGDLFVGQQLAPADKRSVVHAFDVDDTLTIVSLMASTTLV